MSAPFKSKTDGYSLHGITHLSPSSINSWESNAPLWVAEKLLKKKRPAGAPIHRGNVVENAVVAVLTGKSLADAVKAALKEFDKNIIIGDEKTQKERDGIPAMIEMAVEELKAYGKPEFSIDGSQKKVSLNCYGDGWTLPVIGYLDLVYPEHGLVVDLKTTMKMPSKMIASHRRQRCFYQKAMGNQQVKFLYVTPKKSGWLTDGDVDEELRILKRHANRLERFLRISDDADYLASIIPVDPNHFYWGDCLEIRREIFGF